MAFYEIIVINLTQETYTLAIFAEGIWHLHIYCDFTYLRLGQTSDGEHQMRELVIAYAGKKIGLILYRIHCRGKINLTIYNVGRGIMPCGGLFKLMTPALLKNPNLIILLHIISGLGVNPSLTVFNAYSITLSQYSSCNDTTSNGHPYLRAIN